MTDLLEFAKSELRPLHEKLKQEALAGTGTRSSLDSGPERSRLQGIGDAADRQRAEILCDSAFKRPRCSTTCDARTKRPFGESETPRGENRER